VTNRQRRSKNNGSRSEPHRYSTKIIKASALLGDAKTLLSHWNTSFSIRENLTQFRRENLLGKASRSRVEDILAILRQRYLIDESVTRALVVLTKKQFPGLSLDRILYFHAARADRLLHDTVTEMLLPQKGRGVTDIDLNEIQRTLSRWVAEGKTTVEWSEPTIQRVTQGLLAALRDFGVLEGAVKKRIAAICLPVEAFAYLAFYLKQQQPSGARLIDHPDWKLFFLTHEGVERFLIESHQRGLLEYHAAGSVTRLTFPAPNLEEFASVLAERTN